MYDMASHTHRIARVREGRGPGRQAALAGLLAALDLPLRTVAEPLGISERTMHRLKHPPVVPVPIADKRAPTHHLPPRPPQGPRAPAPRPPRPARPTPPLG